MTNQDTDLDKHLSTWPLPPDITARSDTRCKPAGDEATNSIGHLVELEHDMRHPTLILILAPWLTSPAQADCIARTNGLHHVLVELYTSEGCSSCPPADAWLSKLASHDVANRIVPIGFHVDYWDSLGWPDRFAQPAFTQRQQHAARQADERTVYTPQIRIDGTAASFWPGRDRQLSRALTKPAGADITLTARPLQTGWQLVISGYAPIPSQLYVVTTTSGLTSRIVAGENQGRQLVHDHVARQLLGPMTIPFGRFSQTINLPADHVTPPATAVAFLQKPTGNDIIQAIQLRLCAHSVAMK